MIDVLHAYAALVVALAHSPFCWLLLAITIAAVYVADRT